jgi:uncharacterized membrane protein YphA (DoxX/SURF4 family)
MVTFKEKFVSYWKRAEPFLRHQYLALFSRIVLGGIFVVAGAAKISHIVPKPGTGESLFQEMMKYQILPHHLATAYAYVLPPLEVLIGVLLIVGIFQKANSVLSGLITLSFIIAKVSAMARGLDIQICSCFGSLIPLLSVYTLAIDFVMLALSAQIFFHRGDFLALGPWVKSVADRSKEKVS